MGSTERNPEASSVVSDLLETIALSDIAEKNFPISEGAGKLKSPASKFRAISAEFEEFQTLISVGNLEDVFSWFLQNRASSIDEIINRLSRHQVLGYYFLETIDPNNGSSEGYVCLLREINAVPKSIADHIGTGLFKDRYEQLNGYKRHLLNFSCSDMAMPIIEIGSPTIEHLLQSFSNLFGRIGITDPDPEVISKIAETTKLS